MRFLVGKFRDRVILVAAAALTISAVSLASAQSQPTEVAGCSGLSEYRGQMLRTGFDYLAALEEDGIDLQGDLVALSTSQWKAGAEDADELNKELRKIEPPEYAAEWHQLKVEWSGLTNQSMLAIANDGLFAVMAFQEPMDQNNVDTEKAEQAAAKVCPDFPRFVHDWDAIDGVIDGTPVATPIVDRNEQHSTSPTPQITPSV